MGDSSTLLAPGFLNHHAGEGYVLDPLRMERWGFFWRKRIWTFRLLDPHPLMFRDAAGDLWQPDRHESETDLGSVPPPIRGFFPQDEYILSYLFHDSGCRHGGLWVSHGGVYEFHRLTRADVDRKLRDEWIPCEVELSGGSLARRWPVWVGVRLGAIWQPHPIKEE